MRRRIGIAILGVALLSACTDSNSPVKSVTVQSASVDAGAFSVDSLGISFDLADSFKELARDDFEFYAASRYPGALITIQPEEPTIIDYSARTGETVTTLDIDGADAVQVEDAQIQGLPAGIKAWEL